MKKTFIAVLAIASVVACNKAEVIDIPVQQAITFDGPFIENSTKSIDPSHPSVDLDGFNVYGTVTRETVTTNIFNGIPVTKNTNTNTGTAGSLGTYGYATEYTQYWVEGNSYAFAAIAGGTAATVDANGMPLTIAYTYDNAKQVDLLYAANDYGTYTKPTTGETASVAFAFNHLLSLVKFTFTNGYPSDSGYQIKVTDVSVNKPYESATYTINGGTWDSHNASSGTLPFGNATTSETVEGAEATKIALAGSASSNYERLMIPGTYTNLLVSFKVEVIAKDSADNEFTIDKNIYTDVKVPNVTFEPGHRYNLAANITEDLDLITFTVQSVAGWAEGTVPSVPVQ